MYIIHVQIHVKPAEVEAFATATMANAKASLEEPGIIRFDVIQQLEDPTRFMLVEVYREVEDHGRHRQTGHYARWAQTVEPMMAEARTAIKYRNLHPVEESRW
jgi:quinol monooxygenase YgiN